MFKEPFIQFDIESANGLTYVMEAPEGFSFPINEKTKEEFPNCCQFHKSVYQLTVVQLKNADIAKKVSNLLAYTEYIIHKNIRLSNWFDEITNYIDLSVDSFGIEKIGAHEYIYAIMQFIKEANSKLLPISTNKRRQLLNFIKNQYLNKNKSKTSDLIQLNKIYQNWLELFPFRLSYFKELNEHFSKQLPILSEPPKTNPYTHVSKAKVISENELIKVLFNLTKKILSLVTDKMRAVPNINTHKFELLNEKHFIKQNLLLKNFAKGEASSYKILEKWLNNEKNYFVEITPLIEDGTIPPQVTFDKKMEELKSGLNDMDFYRLDSVKKLSEDKQEKLLKLILVNKLPYRIAMFDFLGFLELLKVRCNYSNYKIYKQLSILLNNRKNERTIKGNISVLSEKSNEKRDRFTSYKHKEKVKEDYQELI